MRRQKIIIFIGLLALFTCICPLEARIDCTALFSSALQDGSLANDTGMPHGWDKNQITFGNLLQLNQHFIPQKISQIKRDSYQRDLKKAGKIDTEGLVDPLLELDSRQKIDASSVISQLTTIESEGVDMFVYLQFQTYQSGAVDYLNQTQRDLNTLLSYP